MSTQQITADERGGRPGRWRAVLSPDGPYLWLCYLPIYGLGWIWGPSNTNDYIAAAVALPLFLFFYLNGHGHRDRRALPYIAGILAVALTLAFFFHGNWSVIAVYAAALAAPLRPLRLSLLTLAFIAILTVTFCLILQINWMYWGTALFFGAIVAVASGFSATIEEKNKALLLSQAEVRTMAAAAERERIARDLHDLLGHTLTVVAVKADLAAKLIDRDPARARREMEDLQLTARSALSDIRAAVTGMRRVALGSEIAQARNALAAVDVTLSVRGSGQALPASIDEVLAMLLREGATNVVRHARANRCDVEIELAGDEVRFSLADDGIGGAFREGNGLAGMRARVAALGGTLTVDGAAGTRIRALLPLHALPETDCCP